MARPLLVLLAVATPALAQQLASGTEDGVYHRYARDVCERLGGQAVVTDGSLENLEKLHAGEVEFGLAQQDVTASFLRRHRGSRIRVVDRVFFEHLHIFVRASLHIDSAEDIRSMRLWTGPKGSGTHDTTLTLLDAIGVSWSQCEPAPDVAFEDLPEHFRKRDVDVATLVTVAGAPQVRNGLATRAYRLFPLSYDALRLLTEERAGLEQAQTFMAYIEDGDEEVPSLAVPVLLLTHTGVDPQLVRRAGRTAHEAWERFRRAKGLAEAPAGARPLTEAGLPLADGHTVRDAPGLNIPWLQLALTLAVLWVLGWVIFRWRHGILVSLRSHRLFTSVSTVLLVILVATSGAYFFEQGVNPHFSSMHETFWSMIIYLISGLTDRTPYTPAGRVFAMVVVLTGPLVLAVVTGWVASTLVIYFLEVKMPQNLNDHILVLNWNPRALHVVREVHNPLLTSREGVAVIVVLTDDERINLKTVLKQHGVNRDGAFEDVFFSPGDPTDERALRNANAQDARAVLVLADDRAGGTADERSIRSVFMLRRIARQHGIANMRVVVELVDMSNAPVLEEMAEGFPGVLEYVARGRIQVMLLTQALLNPGFTDLYRDLLSVSAEDNELYTIQVPDAAAGMSFPEYAARVMAHRPERPLVPVGVKRMADGRPALSCNPKPGDPLAALEKGDELIVISYDPPRAADLPVS